MDEIKDGAVAVAEPEDDQAVKITELVEFIPTRVDGVATPANGFPVLIMKSVAEASAAEAEPAEVPEPDWLPAAKALLAAFAADPTAGPGDLYKAVNAAGEVDEGPDIAGGKQAIQLIARLIINEAQELEAGELDETCDIGMLLQGAACLRCWLPMEQGGAMDGDGVGKSVPGGNGRPSIGVGGGGGEAGGTFTMSGGGGGYSSGTPGFPVLTEGQFDAIGGFTYGTLDGVTKDSRTFTAAERKQHAREGNALPDGSYPIPDKDALRRAAVLARSKHGDWKAARRLIARRARELGVANPLDDDGDEKGSKAVSDVADGATEVQDVHEDDGLSKAVEAAVTKALEPYKAEIATLQGKLAKVADLPRPGGPVMALARPTQAATDGIDWLSKAAEAERLASTVTDTADAAAYRQLASQYRRKAAATV